MARELTLEQAKDQAILKITCPSREVADRIAVALVEQNLAACVNIIEGVTSVYRWQGEICRDQETLLLAKTLASKAQQVLDLLALEHPYEVPEAIWTRVALGSQSYLEWMTRSLD